VQPARFATASADTVLAMPIDLLFEFVAVHVIGDKAADADLRIDLCFTDQGAGSGAGGGDGEETWTMWIRRGVLNARRGASPDARLTVGGAKAALAGVLLKPAAAGQPAKAGQITLAGDETVLHTLAGLLDEFDPDFPVVTP
jgi:alkyl sulfatase BDS1-like metallo-beta-lactamase superfamily hydrolase